MYVYIIYAIISYVTIQKFWEFESPKGNSKFKHELKPILSTIAKLLKPSKMFKWDKNKN